MRFNPLVFSLLFAAAVPMEAAKPLIGGLKTIPLDANGNIPDLVVKADAGQGGYLSGAKKIAVPLIAVAFESSASARTAKRSAGTTTTKSLESHLLLDEKVFQSICDELQAIVEKDLAAEGVDRRRCAVDGHRQEWSNRSRGGR